MRGPIGPRCAFLVACLIAAAFMMGMLGPASSHTVEAQPHPTATILAIQFRPPVPELEYPAIESSPGAVTRPALAAATPAPSGDVTSGTLEVAGPGSGGSLTASLAGLDSSASSVGDSHYVDRPARRSKK